MSEKFLKKSETKTEPFFKIEVKDRKEIYYSSPQCGRPGFDPWVGKIPWRRERLPTPGFWPGEFHGLQSMGLQRVGQDWATFTSLHFTVKPVPKTLPSITWNLVEMWSLRLHAPGTWYQSRAPRKFEKPCSQKDQKARGWVFENVNNIRKSNK